MFRCWLIRGIFLFFLSLFVAAWGASTCYDLGGGYSHRGQMGACAVSYGQLNFAWARNRHQLDGPVAVFRPRSFQFVHPHFFWQNESHADTALTGRFFCCLGFCHSHMDDGHGAGASYVSDTIAIPLWFLIVVTGGAGWWAWRKTRAKLDPRTAFPVEVGKEVVKETRQ